MYKNQLQELAQRSCFNLPSYTSFREGPDHAPRFKAAVYFNGESFECPSYCSTLRLAEHSAAEVALHSLAGRGPYNSLAARILDETGVYKNLLQEVSQRVGASLPVYTTFRTGSGHLPVFTCTIELAGVVFSGEPAKNKKQAEKNAAMAAWLSLKTLVQQSESSTMEKFHKDEQEHVTVARALQKYLTEARLRNLSFPINFPTVITRPTTMQQSPAATSKILPFISPKTAPRNRPVTATNNSSAFQKMETAQIQQMINNLANGSYSSLADNYNVVRPHKFAAGAVPYIPVQHCNLQLNYAPPVTMRQMIPVFSAPPLPFPQSSMVDRPPVMGIAPPVCTRQAYPVYAAAPVRMGGMPKAHPIVKIENPRRSITKGPAAEPPIHTLAPGKLDSLYPKIPVLHVEEPLCSSEKVQVETCVSKTGNPPESSVPSAGGSRSAVQDKLQVSTETEALKNLKID